MLADEEKVYRELKDKRERDEFQKIFWARRDPTPGTPENEFQDAITAARTEADAQFKIAGRRGSETDCGRVYLLLGKPDEMKSEPVAENPMARSPETWTYRDRPGQTFSGGQAVISFQGNCELGQGNRYAEALSKIAISKIRSTNLVYRSAEGRLLTLDEQKPKPSPTQTLLKTPRQDFPLVVERKLTMRPLGGNTYVGFVVQAPANAVTPSKVIVTASATDANGVVTALPDRELSGAAAGDGSFTGSVGMTLGPGAYTVNIALLDPATGKGSVATMPVTIADPASGLAVYTITLKGIQEGITPKVTDPMSAFTFGNTVFEPGSVYAPSESLLLLSFLYGGAKDEAGKSSVALSMYITMDGKLVGKLENQQFETPASPTIGPIPLTAYPPGKYTVDVKLKDNVNKTEVAEKLGFEVKAAN